MDFKPLNDRILVERVDEPTATASGIIIPDTAKEKPQEADVVAVGPGRKTDDGEVIKPELKPGLRILIGKYAGNEIDIDGEELVIVNESDVLGIVE